MARTKNGASLEAKALAAASKSDGMRMLYDAGYKVAQVKDIFEVPYGFAYGVAQRHGVVATAADRRAPRKAAASSTTKTTRAKGGRKAQPAETVSATSRVAAKLAKGKASQAAKAKKASRPTTARRAANRKRTTKA